MGTTIRARFSGGALTPLDPVGLKEGDEVTLTIEATATPTSSKWLENTAGGWAGLVDAEELKRKVYESRLLAMRPEPRL